MVPAMALVRPSGGTTDGSSDGSGTTPVHDRWFQDGSGTTSGARPMVPVMVGYMARHLVAHRWFK